MALWPMATWSERPYNGPFDGHRAKPPVSWSSHPLGEVPENYGTLPLESTAVFPADAENIDLRSIWSPDGPTRMISVKKTESWRRHYRSRTGSLACLAWRARALGPGAGSGDGAGPH